MFIGSLIFVQELAEKVVEVVQPLREKLDAILIFPSMPDVMRLNKVCIPCTRRPRFLRAWFLPFSFFLEGMAFHPFAFKRFACRGSPSGFLQTHFLLSSDRAALNPSLGVVSCPRLFSFSIGESLQYIPKPFRSMNFFHNRSDPSQWLQWVSPSQSSASS